MGFSCISSISWSQSGRWARSSWGDEWACIQARWVMDLEVARGRECSMEFLKSMTQIILASVFQLTSWLSRRQSHTNIFSFPNPPTLFCIILYSMHIIFPFFRFSGPFRTECSTISMRKREGNRKRQWGRAENSGRKETTDERQKQKDESSLVKTGRVKQTWCPFSASVSLFLPW